MSHPLDYGRPDPTVVTATRGRLTPRLAVSRQNLNLFYQVIGFVVVAVVGVAVTGGVLSLLGPWVVVGLTAVLAVVVAKKSHAAKEREWRVDQGLCADCGYDLHGLPTRVCPECGRDSTLDEPTWRRLRREHEAKFGRAAVDPTAGVDLDDATVRRLLARTETFDG